MTDIMFLPPELTEQVLGYLESLTLSEDIQKVCQKWADIACKILDQRISKMRDHFSENPQRMVEIRSHLTPAQQEDNHKMLVIYEKALLKKNFRMESTRFSNGGVSDFINDIRAAKGCILPGSTTTTNCDQPGLCFVKSVHWMPCHKLILVQLPEKIEFYHMSVLTNNEEERHDKRPEKYDIVLLDSEHVPTIDSNAHSAVSVFNDRVVCQTLSTRALILFRVKEVSHLLKKTVVLENFRRIFLPLWSCDLLLLEDKVCILFTTGSVGIWRMKQDDIQLSVNTCADVATIRQMTRSKMYMCKNLVIIKIVTEHNATASYSIFDSNDDNQIQLHTIDLNSIIKNSFLGAGAHICNSVFDLFVTLNAFIVHCVVSINQPQDQGINNYVRVSVRYPAVFCRRIKKDPTLQDFKSPDNFKLIFYEDDGDAEQIMTASDSFISPILSQFLQESHIKNSNVFTFVGIRRDPQFDNNTQLKLSPKNEFDCYLFSLRNNEESTKIIKPA